MITPEMDAPLKRVIGLRKALVRDFMKTDHENILTVLDGALEELKAFGPKVEHYLVHELGPVSAFIPEVKNEGL